MTKRISCTAVLAALIFPALTGCSPSPAAGLILCDPDKGSAYFVYPMINTYVEPLPSADALCRCNSK